MRDGGLSAERLKRLHDVMTGYVERGEVPGLVTLVARRGEGHIDAVGAMAAGSEEPMRRDTIFRISSMTKPVTAAAAMILIEECAIRLDEPVTRLLPELADRQVLRRPDADLDDTEPAYRPITVRDLLTFTMGLGIVAAAPGTVPIADALTELELGQGMPSPQTPPAPDEWIRRLGSLPLMYQPGERWMYNTGSDVLGVLIERAAGQPFETFLRERIFDPLGMTDTAFGVPWEQIGRLATSYVIDPGSGAAVVYDEPDQGQWSRLPSFPSGGGGLVSTVDDFLAFADMLRGKGVSRGERILSRPSVEFMTSDQLTPEQKAASGLVPGFFRVHGWGFGVAVVTERTEVAKSVGTYGWDGGMGTSWYNDPAEDLTMILMTQQAWASPIPPRLFRDFWTATYQAIAD
ncbi:MAG: serine hydrolase domain-containing protein [Streptosporangiaceae bacterium]|jgi:CubicO group peptidase (beta-lactamase class C family)